MGGETEWNECPAEDYWLELDRRFGESIAEPGDTPEMTLGRLLILKNFHMTLARGINTIVESEGIVMTSDIIDPLSDNKLAQKLGKGGSLIVKAAIDGPLGYFNKLDALEALGYKFTSNVDRAKAVSEFGQKRLGAKDLPKELNKFWMKPVPENPDLAAKVIRRNRAIKVGFFLVAAGITFSQLARVAWPDSPEAVMAGRLVMVMISLVTEVVLPVVSTIQWANHLVAKGVAATATNTPTATTTGTPAATATPVPNYNVYLPSVIAGSQAPAEQGTNQYDPWHWYWRWMRW